MTIYKTSCPHCGATFKITQDQLNLKSGRARCGNCSQVFQANNYLMPFDTDTATQPIPSDTPKPEPDDFLSSTLNISPQKDMNADDAELDALFEDDSLKRHEVKETNIDVPDDGLIHDDISFDNDAEENLNMDSLGEELSDEFHDTLGNFTAITEQQLEKAAPTKSEDDWIDELLSEDTATADSEELLMTNRSSDSENKKAPEDLIGFLEDIGANTAQFSAIKPSQLTREMTSADLKAVDSTNVANPVVKTTFKKTNPLPALLGLLFWGALCLGLLATLFGQYLYFNFDQMAKHPEHRETLASVCQHVGCELPELDASYVQISTPKRLDDKSDGQTSHIGFTLQNRAGKSLVLPDLQVLLKKNGKVIGGNVIEPNTYLVGKYKRLPKQQPIDAEIRLNKPLSAYDSIEIMPVY